MRTWDRYHGDVLPEAIGIPIPTAERALLRAAQEFCEKTGVWWADLDTVRTRNGGGDISPPRDAIVVKIVGAALNGRDIGLEVPNASTTADRAGTTHGKTRFQTLDMTTFTIMPEPADDLPVIITAWLKPTDDADGIPDHVGDQWSEAIAAGALARILAMSKTDWTNVGRAADKDKEFKAAIGRAQVRAWRGFTNARPRAKAQYF